jgi:hypothetical protein
MSSHHFVKEGQEPALLVVDAIADDHLLSLLEWSPLVLASAEAAEKVASWGVRVDAVFVDGPAHNESVVLEAIVHAGPAAVVEITNGLPDAVYAYLRKKHQTALQIMIASPAESLHLWQDAPDFQVALMDTVIKWSRIPGGRFEKWLPVGAHLLVHASGDWCVLGAQREGNLIVLHSSGLVSVSSPDSLWVGEAIK